MGRSIKREINGEIFKTQKALDEKVKLIINENKNKSDGFYSEFLQSIINTYHLPIIKEGGKSNGKFYFIDYYTDEMKKDGIDEVRFNEKLKDTQGDPVVLTFVEPQNVWTGCTVNAYKKYKDFGSEKYKDKIIQDALRSKLFNDNIIGKKLNGYFPECQYPYKKCNLKSQEYHHEKPTFKEMYFNDVKPLISNRDFNTIFGYQKLDKSLNSEMEYIPSDHKAWLKLVALHDDNEGYWLCKHHHREMHRIKRDAV